MKEDKDRSSWIAIGLFYFVLILIISFLDAVSGLLRLPYWGVQIGLITLGVGIFVVIGTRVPDLTAPAGILLAFTVGILTIIPAVLMGLGQIPGLWPQYFYIAFGMAAGSMLTFVSLKYSQRIVKKEQQESEGDRID